MSFLIKIYLEGKQVIIGVGFIKVLSRPCLLNKYLKFKKSQIKVSAVADSLFRVHKMKTKKHFIVFKQSIEQQKPQNKQKMTEGKHVVWLARGGDRLTAGCSRKLPRMRPLCLWASAGCVAVWDNINWNAIAKLVAARARVAMFYGVLVSHFIPLPRVLLFVSFSLSPSHCSLLFHLQCFSISIPPLHNPLYFSSLSLPLVGGTRYSWKVESCIKSL